METKGWKREVDAGTKRSVGAGLARFRSFDAVIAQIFEGAAERDANPVFPHQPFRVLSEAGLLALPVPNPPETRGRLISFGEEWRILRTVARANGSVGRIFGGHLNAAERVSVLAPEPCGLGECPGWDASVVGAGPAQLLALDQDNLGP